MKKKMSFHQFLIRYGISLVLLLMMVSIAYMLEVIEIKNKVPVELIRSGSAGYTAYVAKSDLLAFENGKTVTVDVPGGQHLAFVVRQVREETSYTVLGVEPAPDNLGAIREAFGGDSKIAGYVFTNRVKLWNLVFNKRLVPYRLDGK